MSHGRAIAAPTMATIASSERVFGSEASSARRHNHPADKRRDGIAGEHGGGGGRGGVVRRSRNSTNLLAGQILPPTAATAAHRDQRRGEQPFESSVGRPRRGSDGGTTPTRAISGSQSCDFGWLHQARRRVVHAVSRARQGERAGGETGDDARRPGDAAQRGVPGDGERDGRRGQRRKAAEPMCNRPRGMAAHRTGAWVTAPRRAVLRTPSKLRVTARRRPMSGAVGHAEVAAHRSLSQAGSRSGSLGPDALAFADFDELERHGFRDAVHRHVAGDFETASCPPASTATLVLLKVM